jgi:hypothetical protein
MKKRKILERKFRSIIELYKVTDRVEVSRKFKSLIKIYERTGRVEVSAAPQSPSSSGARTPGVEFDYDRHFEARIPDEIPYIESLLVDPRVANQNFQI